MTNMKKRLEQLETQTAGAIVGDVVFVRPGEEAPTGLPTSTTIVRFVRPIDGPRPTPSQGEPHE